MTQSFEDPRVLVVDLDGTLLRSNMLYESFWSAFGQDWRSPFTSARALIGGRAALKRHLAERSDVDTATLPFDAEVIAYIERWRARGGRAVLVTASDQSFAGAVGAHLNLFDEVHGSSGSCNLKGAAKAAFLCDRYGEGRYAYMGDSTTDLPVWGKAALAVTVNANADLRRQAEQIAPETEHLATVQASVRPYLRAMRPHQWLKNLLVFLPMMAAHQLTGVTFLQSLAAFVAFSLIASSVYVLNDLLDLDADRAHPRKCKRPFAAGQIMIENGTWMAGGLLVLGCVISALIGWPFLVVVLIYYVMTAAYSLHFKRQTVLDIFTLAGLYTIRVVAGGVATGIPLSVWLLAFSLFFFFSLAAVKRQVELVDMQKRGKLTANGRGYTVDDLPIISMIAIGAGYVSVLVMALYVNSPAVLELYDAPYLLWGICCVLLYWITATVLVAHRGQMQDDPVVYAVRDRVSRICFLIILGCAIWGTVG